MTHIQRAETTFVCILSPLIRIVSTDAAMYAGDWAGVSVLLGGIAGILYIWLLERFISHRRENEGAAELFSRRAGKKVGRLISGVLTGWILFYAGFVLRSSGERITSAVFGRGNVYAVMLLILFVSAVAARGSIKTLGRCGSTAFLITALCLVAILLPAMFHVRAEYVVPSRRPEAGGILKAAMSAFNVMTVFLYTAILAGGDEPKRSDRRRAVRFGGYLTLAMAGVVVCTLGALSPEAAARTDHPFFMMIRNISALGVIERIESVVVGVWVLTDFIYITVLMKIVERMIKIVRGKESGNRQVILEAAAIYIFAVLCGGNFFSYYRLSLDIIPKINLILVAILSVLGAVINIFRKEKNNMT